MDKIMIKQARFSGNIGITPQEREQKQEIEIDLTLFLPLKKSGRSDRITDTINYSEVNKKITLLMEQCEYALIETIAATVAEELLRTFPIVKIIVCVQKPRALKNALYAAVEIERDHD